LSRRTDDRTAPVWPRDEWSRGSADVLMRYEGMHVAALGVELGREVGTPWLVRRRALAVADARRPGSGRCRWPARVGLNSRFVLAV
jgi:hypothetical protein